MTEVSPKSLPGPAEGVAGPAGWALLPADAAFAAADKTHKLERFGGGDVGFNFRQGFLQLQAGAVEQLVGALEDADAGGFEA